MSADRYHFRVFEIERPGARSPLQVVTGECPTKIDMLRELGHYMAVYAQDGAVRGEWRKNRNKWQEIRSLIG